MIAPCPGIKRGTRVGQGDGRPLQLVRGECVAASALDEPLVLRAKGIEGALPGVADHRHHEEPRAVLARAVDGESEMRPAGDARGLAVGGAREVRGHLRLLDRRLRDGIPDQMRERHLRRDACRGERGVELAPARV